MTQARDLADGKFDTDTLVVDAANDRVGMGTTSPYGVSNFMNLTLKGKNASSGGLIRSETSDASITSRIYTDTNGLTLECDTDDNVLFRTNGSERGRWLSGGGLTFNGDTAAANALDDYEEGTFTPSITLGGSATGMTFHHRNGFYTKVGRLVTIFASIRINAVGSSTGSVRVTGMPFQAADLGSGYQHPVGNMIFWNKATTTVYAPMAASSSELQTRSLQSTGDVQAGDADFQNGTAITLTISYHV